MLVFVKAQQCDLIHYSPAESEWRGLEEFSKSIRSDEIMPDLVHIILFVIIHKPHSSFFDSVPPNWRLVMAALFSLSLNLPSKRFLFSNSQRLITGIKPLRLLVGRLDLRFTQWEPVWVWPDEQANWPTHQPTNQLKPRLVCDRVINQPLARFSLQGHSAIKL